MFTEKPVVKSLLIHNSLVCEHRGGILLKQKYCIFLFILTAEKLLKNFQKDE